MVTKESPPPLHTSDTLAFAHGAVTVSGTEKPVEYTIAAPHELRSDTLGLIVPGFGAIKPTSRRLRNSLASQEGMAVLSYDPAREHANADNSARDLANPQELHYRTVSRILEDVTANPNVKSLPNGAEIADQLATLIAHSMGGTPASEFAADNPCVIKQICYLGCVGMENPLGLSIVGRGVKEIINDVLPNILKGKFGHDISLAKRSIHYFASNPKRTLAEIYSCAIADNRENVLKLGQLGMHQIAICFENDEFFRPSDTESSIGHVVNAFLVMPNTDHTAPQTKPVAVAHEIGKLLLPVGQATISASA